MKITFGRIAMWILFLVACPCSMLAQQATVNHNVILRRDPSTASLALEHLSKGARLTLVDATPDGGFYHVRTEDDQVGWVWSKYIDVSSTPAPVTPTTPGTSQPPDTQCDASLWSHVYHPQALS
jgi:uncharacterized protein YgiM (DUF1202 family)